MNIAEISNKYNEATLNKKFIFYNFVIDLIKECSYCLSHSKFEDCKKSVFEFLNNMDISLNEKEKRYLSEFQKVDKKDVNFIIKSLKRNMHKDIKKKDENQIEVFAREINQWKKYRRDE